MFSNQSWAITKRQKDVYLLTDNGITLHKNEKYFCFEDWKLKKPRKIIGDKGRKTFQRNTNNKRKETNPMKTIV